MVARVGTIARLDCAATGYPFPDLEWAKEGVVFPAAAEKRMQIMNNNEPNEPFFILNVKLVDAGVYTCIANNTAGTITTNATLTVLGTCLKSEFMQGN